MFLEMKPLARKKIETRQTNFWRKQMANGWTPERKQRQSELIKKWRPWESSTGPRTPEGKTRAAMRGYKGGVRPMSRKIAKALRGQEKALEDAL